MKQKRELQICEEKKKEKIKEKRREGEKRGEIK